MILQHIHFSIMVPPSLSSPAGLNMLSEGFLCVLEYKEEKGNSKPRSHSKGCTPTSRTPLKISQSPMILKLLKGKEKCPMQSQGAAPPAHEVAPQPSQARSISGIESHQYCGLELYRSWCCPTLCKDYPDLQFQGDHLGDKASESPGLDSRSYEGPLLRSRDLVELDPLQLELVTSEMQRYSAPPVEDTAENSIILYGEPPSNSMLNGYLESKVLEVYRQYMEDNLARYDSFPSCVLPPSLAPPHLPPLSLANPSLAPLNLHLSTEPTSGLLSFQPTSHFSSPVLRISDADLPEQLPMKASQPQMKPL
ncbi:SH3 domain-binding glutamic acid-rich-like protein-like [Arapaima gigas]